MNRTKTTLFIISIIFSVLTVLVSYYGLTRYFSLHFGGNECKGYEKYSTLDKACDGRLVVSFGPTQTQLDKMGPSIRSIIDQTVKVDGVSINIPYSYKHPKEFEKISNIFHTGKDYGKEAKLIPVLLRETDKNTMILILEPDIIYGKDFIENIVAEAVKNPGKAILVENKGLLLQSPDHVSVTKGILVETLKIESTETFNRLF